MGFVSSPTRQEWDTDRNSLRGGREEEGLLTTETDSASPQLTIKRCKTTNGVDGGVSKQGYTHYNFCIDTNAEEGM